MANETKATVATPTANYYEMERKRALCRTLMVGTGNYEAGDNSFLDQAERLLPQYGSEHPDDYRFRRDHLTVVPPDFPDSVDAVVSSILNGPIMLEETLPEFWDADNNSGHWADLDLQGRNGNALMASVGTESIAEGLPWVLVDFWDPSAPAGDGERRPLAAASREARPFWTVIHSRDLIEAYFANGRLERARWFEEVFWPDSQDDWEIKPIRRVRVTFRGDPNASPDNDERYARFETWARKGQEWIPVDEPMFEGDAVRGVFRPPGGLTDDLRKEFIEIPLFPFYSGYKRPGVAWPLLRHQADLIRLWSLMHSDFASAQHYAMNPRDVVIGPTEEQFAQYNPGSTPAGQGNMTFLPKQGDWKILTHDGAAFDSMQTFLDKLMEKIRAAGIETLRSPATGRELATLGLLERERKLTRLEVISMFWESALVACVRRHHLLMGLDPRVNVALPPPNKDLLVSPQVQLKLIEIAATHDKIDPQTFWELAKDIVGNDNIEPEMVAERLAEFQRSMGPLG